MRVNGNLDDLYLAEAQSAKCWSGLRVWEWSVVGCGSWLRICRRAGGRMARMEDEERLRCAGDRRTRVPTTRGSAAVFVSISMQR